MAAPVGIRGGILNSVNQRRQDVGEFRTVDRAIQHLIRQLAQVCRQLLEQHLTGFVGNALMADLGLNAIKLRESLFCNNVFCVVVGNPARFSRRLSSGVVGAVGGHTLDRSETAR